MTEKQKATMKKLREENKRLNKENRQLKKEREHFKGMLNELWHAVEQTMPELQKLKDSLESAQTGIECLEIVSLTVAPVSNIK